MTDNAYSTLVCKVGRLKGLDDPADCPGQMGVQGTPGFPDHFVGFVKWSPQLDCVVARRRGKDGAVRRPGHRVYTVGVSLKRPRALSGVRVPQLDCVVARRRELEKLREDAALEIKPFEKIKTPLVYSAKDDKYLTYRYHY